MQYLALLEPTGRLVPVLRVRGAEPGRGSSQSGSTYVGVHDHRPSERRPVAFTGDCLAACAYPADERHRFVGFIFDEYLL